MVRDRRHHCPRPSSVQLHCGQQSDPSSCCSNSSLETEHLGAGRWIQTLVEACRRTQTRIEGHEKKVAPAREHVLDGGGVVGVAIPFACQLEQVHEGGEDQNGHQHHAVSVHAEPPRREDLVRNAKWWHHRLGCGGNACRQQRFPPCWTPCLPRLGAGHLVEGVGAEIERVVVEALDVFTQDRV